MSDREQLALLAAALLLLVLGARLLPRSAWALVLVGLALFLLALAALERWRTRERRTAIAPPPPGLPRPPLAQVCAQLRRSELDSPRAVLVAGPEGAGKTTLVHAAAWQLREVFPDGVAYVNGRTDTDRPWSRATICALLASYLTPSAALPALSDEGAVAALGERLAGKRVLLVLDHVDGTGTDFVRWLLGQLTPQSALIFTAQKSVEPGPGAAPFPQMPGLCAVPLASLSESEATELLAGSPLAGEARQVLELTGGSLLLIGLLARLRLPGVSGSEVLAQLQAAVKPAQPAAGTEPAASTEPPADPQSAVIAFCVRALDEASQRCLRTLSVFDDAFTVPQLEAACGGRVGRERRALVRAGLLLGDPRPGHHRLHGAVRSELAASLSTPERDPVMQRLTEHVLGALRQACAVLTTGDEVSRAQAHRTVRSQWPQLLTCQAWAAGRAAQHPPAARLCIELGRATTELAVEYFADESATTRRFRDDAVRAARGLAEPALLLECLLAAGRCCLAQRELQRAADCFEEYRQLAAAGAPAPHLQDALAGLAALYARRAEFDRAVQRAEHRLELARAQADPQKPRRLAEAVEQLGSLLGLAGDTERAVEVLGERLQLASEPLERLNALLPLAEATLRLGEIERALAQFDEAVLIARRAGEPSELGTALYCLGRAHMHLGEPRRAQALLLEARAASQAAGQPISVYDEREAELVGRLGDLALELGAEDRAMALYDEQLRLAEADPRADVGLALASLALWHALRGDLAAADARLSRFQELGASRVRLDAIRRVGHLYLQLGNAGRALTVFREVLVHVRKGRHALEEAVALLDVGVTLRRAGETRQAVAHLRLALARAQARKERRVEALASWELGLYHAGCGEVGAAVSALEVGLNYLDAIEYPREAKDYQRNLALLSQLRQQLN